ncbi:hypothetical protein DM01DRAFT_1051426 [Hesseltinella vesiculosa]|uniref:AIG1-type G domain-containing protein n=1 Tax=Hesseltinella vesiculosa TaxID=101127 RepID=A0A1X2GGB5_9FUNG|nr:hypothetical protein DM01DRAFT_1051426 [Hesseltinella vesiculosa]
MRSTFFFSPSFQSVTDAVLERTGVWTVKGKNTIVTVADTPGFADSAGRDFTAEIQDYIFDVSNRIGIDAFLLVCSFKTKIPVVENILKEFAALMKHMEPRDWRKHVILVFTKVDYKHRDLNETTDHKNFLVNQFSKQMKDMLGLEENLPVAFVSNQLPECGITKGRPCDCAPYKEYYFSKMYTLQAKIELCAKLGRWRAIRPPPPPPLPTKQPPPVPPPHAMHPTSHPPPPPHDPYYNAQAPPAHYNPLYVTQHR